MKLVLFNDYRPGLLKGDSVVDLGAIVSPFGAQTGQAAMEAIISHIDDLRDQLSSLEQEGEGVPLSTMALRPPLPRPNKILCMGGNFREFGARQPSPMWGFLKSSESVIGPGDTVVLPKDYANIIHHEAKLVLVFGEAGRDVSQRDAMAHVFGYLAGMDVSARMPGGGLGDRSQEYNLGAGFAVEVLPDFLPHRSLYSHQR